MAMTLLVAGVAVTAVRRTMMEACSAIVAVAGEGRAAIAAKATVAVAAEAASIAGPAIATRTIRGRTGAQLVFRFQSLDGVHLDALLGITFDALQQYCIAIGRERDGDA